MTRLVLVHWNEQEAAARAAALSALGYQVDYARLDGPPALRRLLEQSPAAIVIDLTRLPSHGREIARAIRYRKSTRHIPLVFAGGLPDKVDRTRADLPDAVYTAWDGIAAALRHAIAHPPADPVSPESLIGAPDKPVPAKLGIQPGMKVALLDAPDGFALAPLPENVTLTTAARGADLALWFVRDRKTFHRRLAARAAALAPKAVLWICWPKKTSGVASDVTQQVVRDAGLAAGLVDDRICRIDDTWAGLRFRRRKPQGDRR